MRVLASLGGNATMMPIVGLIGFFVSPYSGRGSHYDCQVQNQRPMPQVIHVEFEPLAHGFQIITAAVTVDLCPTGDSRFDLVAQHVTRDQLSILLIDSDRVRSRSDHAKSA